MEYLEYKSDKMFQNVMLYEKLKNFFVRIVPVCIRILNEQT